jgi:CHASE3 domain sensor protein
LQLAYYYDTYLIPFYRSINQAISSTNKKIQQVMQKLTEDDQHIQELARAEEVKIRNFVSECERIFASYQNMIHRRLSK